MTAEAELRAILKHLRGPHGILTQRDRFVVMSRQWSGVTHAHAYDRPPYRRDLLNLAAHAVMWAEEISE